METEVMSTNKRSAVVSLIGRPNVGKSSIFNRLMRKNYKAMTHDLPGVTRDRHYGIASLMDRTEDNPQDIILVDTGGFYPEKVEEVEKLGKRKTAEPFFNLMADHAKIAIQESDLILFVVDVREGLLPFDKSICDYIRTTKKKMWLMVNKFDSDTQWGNEAEFYELGLHEDQYFIVSAEHGRGLGELRERLYDFTTEFNKEITESEEVQKGVKPNHDVVSSIALIGAPNAGKSTLLNNLVGAQRAVVSNIAGTTVDPIEGYFDLYFGKDAEVLKAQENAFRKTNMDLYKELVHFEDEFHEEELIAYENLSADMKDSSLDDTNEDEMKVDESIEDDIEEQSLYSLDDMSEALVEK
jgi:GTP-binding protein